MNNPLPPAFHDFATHRLMAEAADWSLGQAPQRQLWREAAQLGAMGLQVSRAHGGLGLGFAAKAALAETWAAADFGFAMSVINTHNVAWHVSRCEDEALRDRVLPALLQGHSDACTALTEPGAGSDFGAIQTSATRHDDHWLLDGEKRWIINARRADWAIVYAQSAAPGSRDGVGAFLVDLRAPGVQRYALDSAFSQHSMGTGGFRLHQVRVPLNQCLGAPGQAFRAILQEINGARVYVAAMAVGMLHAALQATLAYGQQRQSFGQSLMQHQAWRMAWARAHTDLSAMRALVDAATLAIEHGQDAQALAAQAKVFAVERAQHHLPILLHAMGAHGLDAQQPLARHLAAIQMASLTDGSDEMLLERIAQLATRPSPKP